MPLQYVPAPKFVATRTGFFPWRHAALGAAAVGQYAYNAVRARFAPWNRSQVTQTFRKRSRFASRYQRFRRNRRGLPPSRIKAEMKHFDVQYLGHQNLIPSATKGTISENNWYYGNSWVCISGVGVGTGAFNRIGAKFQIVAIQLKADFNYRGTGSTITAPQRIRVVILRSHDCATNDLIPSSVYSNQNGSALTFGTLGGDLYNRALNQSMEHTVLHDELIEMDEGFLSETMRVYKKCNIIATGHTGASATYDFSNLSANGISILFLPEIAGTSATCSSVRWVSRISYYDA